MTEEQLKEGKKVLANVHQDDITSQREWDRWIEVHGPTLLAEIDRLRKILTGIQEMADMDIGEGYADHPGSSLPQIEADARAAITSPAHQSPQ